MAPPAVPVCNEVAAPYVKEAFKTGFPDNSNTKPHFTCTSDGAILMDRFGEANRSCINRSDMLWYERTRDKHPQLAQMKAKIATRDRLHMKLMMRKGGSDAASCGN